MIDVRCIISLVVFPAIIAAQPASVADADAMFSRGDYGGAVAVYEQILSNNPDNAAVCYKAGTCYLQSRSLKHKAVPYFEKAAAASHPAVGAAPQGVGSDVLKLLGDACTHAQQYSKAAEAYTRFRAGLVAAKAKPEELDAIDRRIEVSRLGAEIQQKTFVAMNRATGSPCELRPADYTATASPDKSAMIYTLRVPLTSTLFPDARYYEGPYIVPQDTSTKQDLKNTNRQARSKPKQAAVERDSMLYAGTVGSSFDGHAVLTYRNEKGRAVVQLSRLSANSWSQPVNLHQPLNAGGWEPNAFVLADGSEMYFASDRAGGYGGYDIYKCTRLPDGSWSRAVNLGPSVNSPAHEVAPFVHGESRTLFFSSNRVKAVNYDIFSYALAGEGKVANIGYPVNRDTRDIFQVTADNRKMFISGSETQPTVSEKREEAPSASFLITFLDQSRNPGTVLNGRTVDEKGEPVSCSVTVVDNITGERISGYLVSGDYAIPLPGGRDCELIFESPGRIFQTQHAHVKAATNFFDERQPVSIPALTVGAVSRLEGVVFGSDGKLAQAANPAVKKLTELLNAGPYIEGELVATVIATSDKKMHKAAAKARLKAVAEALKSDGIHADRIVTKVETVKPPKQRKGVKKAQTASPPDNSIDDPIIFRITKNKQA